MFRNKKGQTAMEYVLTTAAVFVAFTLFYKYYTWVVPKQYENGARVILAVYELE